MSDAIINKVAESGLITLDLEAYYPKEEIVVFDLKPYLFRELILKEKEFRQAMQEHDWSQYKDKIVAAHCSADAIIPMWAYMLVASYLQPFAANIIVGTEEDARRQLFLRNINSIDTGPFTDQRIIIKGCGDLPIGEYAYLEITKRLRPIAKTIMYGEPCNTVPVYKRK